ncbi:Serpentine receptor class gamma-30 [Caenorhabditis elegans]|uniref:Serpentine receptor class gamma-30 n=1 Tax=Caenorhabditis elegans TaxID=6239 RepID=SRG30_CAEEL|nr:Serpentine receptor class gamma-30 [Caenorhabditis elegans]O45150.3 RecName: Full=Serpentine receptor class gamma-30; Short=Protein srg-30 [Caenorhabditis elegans]CCD72938.1 Serpentine receptor class gamma-30 [Caenorhabditis elegans]|eukprot:NP_504702.3 Serpentine receptor class gamma-30 [Caenorhabditis elegans]
MLKCHPGFNTKLELLKYGIQFVYFIVGLGFHFAVIKVLHKKWSVYSKYPFLKLYYVDSILSVLIILLDLVLIRVFNYIPPLCQWVLQEFPEPSQLISILFIEQYLQFVKSLIFCFMVVNRANNVICVKSFGTIQSCIIPHVIVFCILCPLLGVWTAFLSDSRFVPFQGGFIHETMMEYHWITVSQFSVIISSITIVTVCICSVISMLCISRTHAENKHTEQSLTASALAMSIFYVFALSMNIYCQKAHASSLEMLEFWKALTAFAFDIILVCPPVIMLCLNVRLRINVFSVDTRPTSPK